MKKDLATSVRARLLNTAKAQGADFNQILVRFALERILYRLSQSAYADHFLLKGALLFTLWYDMPHRSTRDADLLGFGASDLESIARTFHDIASIEVADGIVFDPASVSVEEIRKDAGYAGARVLITAEIAKARCKTQIDIGFGDAVTPGPVHAAYPVLIDDLPAPQLRTNPVYTVIAEKLHAIALLGMTNSRLKDYLDIWVLLDREVLNANTLAKAIAATFIRRGMPLPVVLPVGLTDEFATDTSRQAMWQAFLKKNEIVMAPLPEVVAKLRTTLAPILIQAASIQATGGSDKSLQSAP
ncbi:nucleotidyl transferase AbiEii/AbiGii toxin family protein [Ferribacterium limneticum]|uniref:nucleotidyl transferase AbiEii/AbiGii toxin family protein n=1 Tax=Ferribacterium limneticum TaxID=76259 RepID=UPI001CFBFD4F|nr:nucleotidyl transferase AbiEii/AbiGii toxin family protein [Ferribacterium limneticum]UCV29432.1 nucleotidyl transferase AbiEii/AbiGii toxin family protein [Ferribacterium limneticum]UCV33351.1 nucleotidyl transferase AbiEii/AbiGii toxin family protein [Ferribacterium limneticum]